MYRRFGKRLLDFTVASIGLVLLSPVLLIIAAAIWLTMGRPVLFRQRRPGLLCKPFELYKFRTMTNARGENDRLLPDGKRLTRIGVFLRATSLDELPELWNVVKGEMSLVGPRPLLMEYLNIFTDTEKQRQVVRPGITGLAQVNGRNSLEWNERLAYDLQYISDMSLLLDSRILISTVCQVVGRKGVIVNADNNPAQTLRKRLSELDSRD